MRVTWSISVAVTSRPHEAEPACDAPGPGGWYCSAARLVYPASCTTGPGGCSGCTVLPPGKGWVRVRVGVGLGLGIRVSLRVRVGMMVRVSVSCSVSIP